MDNWELLKLIQLNWYYYGRGWSVFYPVDSKLIHSFKKMAKKNGSYFTLIHLSHWPKSDSNLDNSFG